MRCTGGMYCTVSSCSRPGSLLMRAEGGGSSRGFGAPGTPGRRRRVKQLGTGMWGVHQVSAEAAGGGRVEGSFCACICVVRCVYPS